MNTTKVYRITCENCGWTTATPRTIEIMARLSLCMDCEDAALRKEVTA